MRSPRACDPNAAACRCRRPRVPTCGSATLVSGKKTYVFVANKSFVFYCTLDHNGNPYPGGQSWVGWSHSDEGITAEARTTESDGGGDTHERVVGGQAGIGIARVVVRWSNGLTARATVHNGAFIARYEHPKRLVGRHDSAGEPIYRSYRVIGYDSRGRAVSTEQMPPGP